MATVAQRIRTLRELRGWTQKYLAEKAGMHEVLLQNYEYGNRSPRPEQIQKLSQALEVDIAFLQPARLDTPMALYALLFDLVEQYGDMRLENKGTTAALGINCSGDVLTFEKFIAAMNAHKDMTPAEFKQWLINNPPVVHNGKIVEK